MGVLANMRRLLRDQGGVAVVELALAAPILALMVVGVAAKLAYDLIAPPIDLYSITLPAIR